MKILLDHNVPHVLRQMLPSNCEAYTAQYMEWSSLENGELIRRAENEGFDILVTLDRDLVDQQPTHAFGIGIVVFAVHPPEIDTLKNNVSRLTDALPHAAEEQKVVVIN